MFPGTSDKRIDLCPQALDRATSKGLYAYHAIPTQKRFPLTLISPSTSRAISSTLYQLVRDLVPVEIHPQDARERGIADGDSVRMFNNSGEVLCAAKLNADLRPGVAALLQGFMGSAYAQTRPDVQRSRARHAFRLGRGSLLQ